MTENEQFEELNKIFKKYPSPKFKIINLAYLFVMGLIILIVVTTGTIGLNNWIDVIWVSLLVVFSLMFLIKFLNFCSKLYSYWNFRQELSKTLKIKDKETFIRRIEQIKRKYKY